jgi:hypothetical protein
MDEKVENREEVKIMMKNRRIGQVKKIFEFSRDFLRRPQQQKDLHVNV